MGDSAATGGLFNSLRRLLSTALEMLQVRMELLGTELELEKQRILAGLLFGVAAVLVLIVGVVLACGFVILLMWEGYRLAAVGVLALLFLGGGALLLHSAQSRLRSPGGGLLAASMAELARDRERLTPREQEP